MSQLAQHGPLASLLLFFTLFLCFAFWAYRPANKERFESYGRIPLKEPKEIADSSSDTGTP
ncbi:MAG: cbb3-type cytochrome c oxidase subunit 3 [Bdellovibrionales bacterium]